MAQIHQINGKIGSLESNLAKLGVEWEDPNFDESRDSEMHCRVGEILNQIDNLLILKHAIQSQ